VAAIQWRRLSAVDERHQAQKQSRRDDTHHSLRPWPSRKRC
jgi:hypothetical protein